ncbi:MAG: hypothetical protein PWP46_1489 [Fusobacteriaceae bacterium]|jgi:ribonucleoside-triphosphate reductase|nr:hypothetical protein [Fusobacteriaceae bacterium]
MEKILFTTKSCPNCPPVKEMLKPYDDIKQLDAHENMDLVSKYGIRAVPTLIVDDGNNFEMFTGYDKIKSFIDKQ